ncbi:MAG: hypothetical protein AB1445_01675 [Bacillota bacterium]
MKQAGRTPTGTAQELKARARDGKIACAVLLALAVQLDVPPLELGRLADELGLKICACQLGCFR